MLRLLVQTGKKIVSIALEKQQSAQLPEKIDEILTLDGNPFHVPTSTPLELVGNEDLEPLEEQFLADDDTEEVLRVKMPVGTARASANRTWEIVGSGRPSCVICGQPIDADGHTCSFPEN